MQWLQNSSLINWGIYLYLATRVKWSMCEAYCSRPFSAKVNKVKTKWTYKSTLLNTCIACTGATYCRQELIKISTWIRAHRSKQAETVHLTWVWTPAAPTCPHCPRCWTSSFHSSPAPLWKVSMACPAVRSLYGRFPLELQPRLLSYRVPGCFLTVAA